MKFSMTEQEKGDILCRWLLNRGNQLGRGDCIL